MKRQKTKGTNPDGLLRLRSAIGGDGRRAHMQREGLGSPPGGRSSQREGPPQGQQDTHVGGWGLGREGRAGGFLVHG